MVTDESATIHLSKEWFEQRAAKKAAQKSIFEVVEQGIKSKGDEIHKFSLNGAVSQSRPLEAIKVPVYSSWYQNALKHADEYEPFKNIMSFDQWALVKYGDGKSQKLLDRLIKTQSKPSVIERIKNLFSRKKDLAPLRPGTKSLNSGISIDEIKVPKHFETKAKDIEISYGVHSEKRTPIEIEV